MFLLPNTTTKLQSGDAGITQAIKLSYRTKHLRKITFAINGVDSATSLPNKVTLFDAIMWLRLAWASLEELTIRNCFAKCGISYSPSNAKENFIDDHSMQVTEEILPSFKWNDARGICRTWQ